MKLEKWTLAAEVLSAAAVVATLIVLILQISESNRLERIASYQDITWQFNAIRSSAMSDPEMLELLSSMLGGRFPDKGSPEGLKVGFNLANNYNVFNVAYYSYKSGVIGDDEWIRFKRTMCTGVGLLPDIWRQDLFVRLTDDFIAYIEQEC